MVKKKVQVKKVGVLTIIDKADMPKDDADRIKVALLYLRSLCHMVCSSDQHMLAMYNARSCAEKLGIDEKRFMELFADLVPMIEKQRNSNPLVGMF